MELHIFQCSKNSGMFGFTEDATGANLPNDLCREWIFFKTRTIEEGTPLMGGNPTDILNGVRNNGYHISFAGISFDL